MERPAWIAIRLPGRRLSMHMANKLKAAGLARVGVPAVYIPGSVASVARDLRVGNVVDLPNYAVSLICPLEIFDKM
jgi:acetamidase/formamidase